MNIVPLAREISVVVAILAVCVSAATFVFSAVQYAQSTRLRRFEKYYDMSKRFYDNATLQEVIARLESGRNEDLKNLPKSKKDALICFVEDVAVMQNSRLIKPELAAYTFGYYAKKCWDSTEFWAGLNRNDPFYKVFQEFASTIGERVTTATTRDMHV